MKVHCKRQRRERSSSSLQSSLFPIRFNHFSSSYSAIPLIGMKSLIIIYVSSLCLIFQNVVCSSSQHHRSFQSTHPAVAEVPPPPTVGSINKVPSAPIWPDGLYTQSSYYYADYKIPQPPPKRKFVPDPPSCPETGRTVCQEVEKYPSEQVFDVIRTATARGFKSFNFSSQFMDESENDDEPKFPKSYAKPTGKAYIVYQAALPVVPISYINHHNNGYGRSNQVDSYGSNGGSGGQRLPTHRVVFPNNNNQQKQAPLNNYRQSYSPDQTYQEPVPSQQPLQHHQQQQLQTPASFGSQNTQQGPPSSQHEQRTANYFQQRGSRFDLKSDDYRQPNYFPPATSSSASNRNYPTQSSGTLKLTNSVHGTKSSPLADWRPYYPAPTIDGLSEGSDYRRLASRSVDHGDETNGFYLEQEKIPMSRMKRQAEDEEIEDVCRTQKQFISPRAALNDRAEWKYIVNLGERDPRVRQVIKVDVCSNPNEPCSNQISLPFGFVSRCKQKYIKKKLLSLDPDGQGTSSENFFVPSCCVCEIVRVNNRKKK